MPVRKRFVRKFKRRIRKRFARHSRIPRRRSSAIYNYKQTVELTNVTMSAQSTGLFGYGFKLSDCSNLSSFTDLYDNFRLLAVRVTFYPEFTASLSSASNSMCEIYTVIDPDSSAAPASINFMGQYQTLRRQLFNRPHTRYFKPFAQFSGSAIFGTTGTTTSCLVPRKNWYNVSQPGIVYAGLLGAITASSTASIPAQVIRVTAIYYLQFRNVV